jgi:autotransporter-associated beta strand protein
MKGSSTLNFDNTGAQINLQAIGATVTASSSQGNAPLAIDSNTGTRWESVHNVDPQWIYIDLKSVYNIASVNIFWEAASAKNMQLQTATSNASNPNQAGPGATAANGWTTVLDVVNQNPVTNAYTPYNLPGGVSGQYLAMYGTVRNLPYGYSIYEMQVFQASSPVGQSIGSLSGDEIATTVSIGSQLTLTTGTDNSSTSFAGAITGGGNLVKSGTGTFTLAGANNYLGTTTVSNGTLKLAANTALGTGGQNTSSVAVNNAAVLDLGGNSPAALSLGLNSTVAAGALTNSGAVGAVWSGAVAMQRDTAIGGNAGSITLAGGLAGVGFGLTKVGSDTLILSGPNTYTGQTSVNAGELRVMSSIASSVLTVINGGMLTGSGTVGALNLQSGVLAPGTSPGTLNTGDILLSGGIFAVEIASAVLADQLNVTGTAGLGANTELSLSLLGEYDPVDGDSWVLVNNNLSDAFATNGFYFTSGGIPILDGTPFIVGSESYVLQYNAGTNGNDVVLTAGAVPEPGSIGLLLTGALGVLGMRPRRR